MHPNRQFWAHFVVHMPSCLHGCEDTVLRRWLLYQRGGGYIPCPCHGGPQRATHDLAGGKRPMGIPFHRGHCIHRCEHGRRGTLSSLRGNCKKWHAQLCKGGRNCEEFSGTGTLCNATGSKTADVRGRMHIKYVYMYIPTQAKRWMLPVFPHSFWLSPLGALSPYNKFQPKAGDPQPQSTIVVLTP